jgi:hypothetical protein
MAEINLKSIIPHEKTDYRSLAFLVHSLEFLDNQYQIPNEGITKSLLEIGWGIEPPNLLSSLIEKNTSWLETQAQNPESEELADELFCNCNLKTHQDLLTAKREYFSGLVDWFETITSWYSSIHGLSTALYDKGTLLDFSSSYGQPNWSENPRLVEHNQATFEATSKVWKEIHSKHSSLLDKSPIVATYGLDQDYEFRALGGCFFHVTNSEGFIRVTFPDENAVEIFCDPQTDCVQFGEDGDCVINHDCLDDSLDDMRATLTLFR